MIRHSRRVIEVRDCSHDLLRASVKHCRQGKVGSPMSACKPARDLVGNEIAGRFRTSRAVSESTWTARTPDVLDVDETKALLSELKDPFWTMVFVAATTGLRVSEILGMKWQDVVSGAEKLARPPIVDGVVGDINTEASRKPVPLDSALAEVLLDWRARTPYNRDQD